MARVLTVQNAEINTASITIRTLQVEGRQVTMGVFRQLPVEDIVNQNPLSLRGVGWGHVNYMKTYSADLHVVWQKGSELRRCIVRRLDEGRFDFRPFQSYYYRDTAEYDHGLASWKEERAAALVEYEEYRRRIKPFNDLVAPLFDLPQLFIAV